MTRPSLTLPILVTLAVLFALLGAYVGGYFWLGEARRIKVKTQIYSIDRIYPYEWQATIYKPVAISEARLGGYQVHVSKRVIFIQPSS